MKIYLRFCVEDLKALIYENKREMRRDKTLNALVYTEAKQPVTGFINDTLISKEYNFLREKKFERVLINIPPPKNALQTKFIISPTFIKPILKESTIYLPATITGVT